MSFGNKQPRTVSQITANLQKIVDELEVSAAQYEEKVRKNEEWISRLTTENDDIWEELKHSASVTTKLKNLLGG